MGIQATVTIKDLDKAGIEHRLIKETVTREAIWSNGDIYDDSNMETVEVEILEVNVPDIGWRKSYTGTH